MTRLRDEVLLSCGSLRRHVTRVQSAALATGSMESVTLILVLNGHRRADCATSSGTLAGQNKARNALLAQSREEGEIWCPTTVGLRASPVTARCDLCCGVCPRDVPRGSLLCLREEMSR